ncbi:MAG: class I tRNA ligase family protein, partial [Fusobacteriaceae bacterium]
RLYNNEEGVDVVSKTTAQYVLWTMLEGGLRMLHPFMPFMTEEIWQKIKVEGETIMLCDYPQADESLIDSESVKAFEYVQGLISSLRNIKAEVGISPAKEVKVTIRTKDVKELDIVEKNYQFITKLAKIEELSYGTDLETPEQSGFRVNGNSEVFMILTGLLNVEAETKKINEQIAKIVKDLEPVNRKLSDEKFTSKAPAHILDREKRIQKEFMDKLEKLQENLKNLV